MVKVASTDIIAILRRFEIAGDENTPRHVEQISFDNTTALNTFVSFRFRKQRYIIIFDDAAHDDDDYIMEHVKQHNQTLLGTVARNLTDQPTEFALSYRDRDVYLFEVTPSKRRLDIELSEKYPELSRSTWQKHVKAGHVMVNGEVQESPKADIGDTDDISIQLPDAADFSDHELPIVYIDDNVIVINKPIGVLSHAKGALNDEFSVADFFSRYSTYNSDTNRPGIIHRLDRDTSGIMIGARNEATATLLQKQFADRRAKKTYIAIVDGHPENGAARIELPIERNPSKPSTFRVGSNGKDATTDYTVLDSNDKMSLVELRPRTGRTHQLRVHMAYLRTPIHGDRIYGKASDRLYLHAQSLELTLPGGVRQTFEAPVPAEFTAPFPKES